MIGGCYFIQYQSKIHCHIPAAEHETQRIISSIHTTTLTCLQLCVQLVEISNIGCTVSINLFVIVVFIKS